MKNTTTGGADDGSSSNPPPTNRTPPPTDGSPRRRTGTETAPHGGRGSPQRPPPMGVPGQSAFSPYRRQGGPSGSGLGRGGSGASFQAVPVGGGGSGVAAPGALRIGGSPAARKRGRDGVGGSGGSGGNQPGDVPRNAVNCSVCGKEFLTPKALFGHMRSHPGRGWKGAHPPPAFRAEEEFADLRMEVAAATEAAEAADAGGEEAEDGGAREEAEDGQSYRLPDLNNPPPPENN